MSALWDIPCRGSCNPNINLPRREITTIEVQPRRPATIKLIFWLSSKIFSVAVDHPFFPCSTISVPYRIEPLRPSMKYESM